MTDTWDLRFLGLARHVAAWSKDPSTKTGAVLADNRNRVLSLGFNGFPAGVPDRREWLVVREEKYKRIVHCEMNAILFANVPLLGATLYTWPFMSCARCAAHVIQVGIARCVAPYLSPTNPLYARWHDDIETARDLFREAGVVLDLLPIPMPFSDISGAEPPSQMETIDIL